MERVWTTQLGAHVGERVRVAGWLHRLRLLSNFSFLILRDGQGLAQIFIDDELQVPVRYAAWGWPSSPGGEMPLLEEYTYLKIALNQGLTDRDFDHENPDYNFVRRKS